MNALNFYKLTKANKITVFEEIQKHVHLPLASIEKDWWVVQSLGIVFSLDVFKHLVFKGGTSLSKAWGLIERFSEDIDLSLDREFLGFTGNVNRTQVGKLRDASFAYISTNFLSDLKQAFNHIGFDDVNISLVDVKSPDQDPVKIEISYQAVTPHTDYLKPKVVLEIGSRSLREPFTTRKFCSLVGEQFAGQAFADDKIKVPCVNPERSFLEKLFLLHEEFQRPKEKIRVDRLSRHLYDIHRIANTPYAEKAMNDPDLYKSIVAHRKRFTKLSGVDYTSHFPPGLQPIPPAELRPLWEKDYKTMQKQMIYGISLPFDKLIEEIQQTVNRINQMNF